MLGEKIVEETGKVIGMRVLPHNGHGARMEISMQVAGKVLGIDATDVGTYESTLQANGHFTGTGHGITMTKDGDGAIWTATGTGRPTGKGMAAQWRGSIQYEAKSPKLARLNGLCGIFEYDVDEAGNCKCAVFEWR